MAQGLCLACGSASDELNDCPRAQPTQQTIARTSFQPEPRLTIGPLSIQKGLGHNQIKPMDNKHMLGVTMGQNKGRDNLG